MERILSIARILVLLVVVMQVAAAAENGDADVGTADGRAPSTASDLLSLKAKLAAQQRQIEQLQDALTAQKKLVDQLLSAAMAPPAKTGSFKSLGEVASAS